LTVCFAFACDREGTDSPPIEEVPDIQSTSPATALGDVYTQVVAEEMAPGLVKFTLTDEDPEILAAAYLGFGISIDGSQFCALIPRDQWIGDSAMWQEVGDVIDVQNAPPPFSQSPDNNITKPTI
jgi:hypothetical protein